MSPGPYEIYDANLPLNAAQYARPCVVIQVEKQGVISVFAISSAMALYKGPHYHFKIERTDPDFHKTGLTVDSYVIGERSVPISQLELIRKRGQLEGDLLNRFLKWM